MTRSTTNRRNRAKGQEYERRLCRALESAMPGTRWKRRTQTRGARVDGSDVEGTDAQGRPVLVWIEAHNGTQKLEDKLSQAIRDAPEGWRPIAVAHRPASHYSNDRARMMLSDLLELLGMPGRITEAAEGLPIETEWSRVLMVLGKWWGEK